MRSRLPSLRTQGLGAGLQLHTSRLSSVVAACLMLFVGASCKKTSNSPVGGDDGGNTASPSTEPATPAVHEPVVDKELMIRDLSVVNDSRANGPDGAWSFGGLMKRMAGTTNVSRFVVNWLKTWEAEQTINGFSVPARAKIRTDVINPWKAKDGQADIADDLWDVNLANAPFRLLAIVNRIDLNRGDDQNPVTSAGEGRFVFGVLDSTGGTMRFTVIFEYELLATDTQRLRGWAHQWHKLGTLPFGAEYNAELEKITEMFSGADKAPSKPNGSPLNQIRTNENALDLLWELREFNIDGTGFLKTVPTKQSPDNSLQDSPVLAKFINNNEAAIIDKIFQIPLQFEGASFLAGSSTVPPGFFWKAPGVANNQARHNVSLAACNGCHHRETKTNNFLHIAPRAANATADLSGFLTGIEVEDPVNVAVKRTFNDLADRTKILKDLLTEPGAIRLQALQKQRRFRVH